MDLIEVDESLPLIFDSENNLLNSYSTFAEGKFHFFI